METEDMINLPASSNSVSESENNELRGTDNGAIQAESQHRDSIDDKDKIDGKNMGLNEGEMGSTDTHALLETDGDKALMSDSSSMDMRIESTENVAIVEKLDISISVVRPEDGCSVIQHKTPTRNHMADGTLITGVKRSRMTYDEQQPSVHVKYDSLTSASKRKLEELLQQWSEWHAQHCSSQVSNEVLESGEDTYFPALHFGLEKYSAVSFWIDNQTKKQESNGFISLDSHSVPLYDRGYAFSLSLADGPSNMEGALEIMRDASRCFNCESYSHSLKECPKPRDNVAVNNARRQHKSKRNQNPGLRNPTRYYQNSTGGKYDGLRPGALDTETRQLLGLGEFDPPPWLNRMREMGYPPGYLDPDDEDQPSGITIYGDKDIKADTEDGEIMENDYSEKQRKMTVEFPGINAPIPENADEKRWEAGPSTNSDLFRKRSHRTINSSSEPVSRGHYYEQRWSRDFRDDGPPGCDPVLSPSASYPPRYSNYDSIYSPRDNIQRPRSPTLERSQYDRGRRVYNDSTTYGSYNSSPYSSSNRHNSWRDRGFSRLEYDADEIPDDHNFDSSYRRKDESDSYHRRHSRW
ncbi:zinc finger CCHC domain-containing protein 8-like [Tripterygium wilfordii]|nr:zinc finger CCHC domain-containing protein 8-like [Tripterygium wilfordii]XP_038697271.1 zinc finger CCHC domain-containing protein 8-like [Tripterygium wilfordii]